jgi:hypothetical protein
MESHGNLQNVSRLAPLKVMSVGVNVHVGPDGVLGKGIGAHEGSVKTFAASADWLNKSTIRKTSRGKYREGAEKRKIISLKNRAQRRETKSDWLIFMMQPPCML